MSLAAERSRVAGNIDRQRKEMGYPVRRCRSPLDGIGRANVVRLNQTRQQGNFETVTHRLP